MIAREVNALKQVAGYLSHEFTGLYGATVYFEVGDKKEFKAFSHFSEACRELVEAGVITELSELTNKE